MNKEEFINKCRENLNIIITEDKMNQLNEYYNLLCEWNNKFNLTTIIEYEEVLLKHFYDSLCLRLVVDLDRNISLCDMGTGAGFPGIVLKILFEKLDVTLLESNGKKCMFLNEVINKLGLKNIVVENTRVEDYASDNKEKFDIVTTRAMAKLRIISELALPMLKIGGMFVPLKSHLDDELDESNNIIKILGARLDSVFKYNLISDLNYRSIPIIIKENRSKDGYPRSYSAILRKII